MDEMLLRVWNDLVARTTGPMWFRLILQPAVAVYFGVRAGRANARAAQAPADDDQSPGRGKRKALFLQALRDVGKVFLIGVGLDMAFQLIALRTVYPLEALLVAFVLVALPYQIVRTVFTWLVPGR